MSIRISFFPQRPDKILEIDPPIVHVVLSQLPDAKNFIRSEATDGDKVQQCNSEESTLR